jgi:hypothetical protein
MVLYRVAQDVADLVEEVVATDQLDDGGLLGSPEVFPAAT